MLVSLRLQCHPFHAYAQKCITRIWQFLFGFQFLFFVTKLDFPIFIGDLSGSLKFWCGQSLCRDYRASKAALFDGIDNIEEGGIRASSSYSREIDDHTNDKALDSLEDRVGFLKRVSFSSSLF